MISQELQILYDAIDYRIKALKEKREILDWEQIN